MNILHINTLTTGGAAKACIRLHKGLLKNGNKSKILTLHNNNHDITECYSMYKSKKRALYKRILHKLVGSREYKIRKLPKEYEKFSFPTSSHRIDQNSLLEWADIIHLHWVTGFIDYPSFFKKVNKPIVWTLHDMSPFSGGYPYKEKFPIKLYKEHIKKVENTKKKSLKKANLSVVPLSNWIFEQSISSNVFKNFEHYLIPNGLDVSIFKPLNPNTAKDILSLPNDKKILLFVADSTTNDRKGYMYLINALKLINHQEIVLVVLGKNFKEIEECYNCISLGEIYDEALMSIVFSAVDLFVIPSIEDNLPNTVMESISCGTPVVGFSIGGIPDMVEHGKNGFLSDDVTPESLARMIDHALNTDFDLDWIRNNAVMRFDDSIQVKRYIDLYCSVFKS